MKNLELSNAEVANAIELNRNNPEFMKKIYEAVQTVVAKGNEAQNASSDEPEVEKVAEMQEVVIADDQQDDTTANSSATATVENDSNSESAVETLFQETEETSGENQKESAATTKQKKLRTFKPKESLTIGRKYYTIQEVADCFRIGVSTLHKYLKDGKINGIKIGNQWRFSEDALIEFEKGLC